LAGIREPAGAAVSFGNAALALLIAVLAVVERAFGLDHLHQGVLAICGFGYRASHMTTVELDPAGEIWTTGPSREAISDDP